MEKLSSSLGAFLTRNTFFSSVLLLAGGTALGQLIAVAASPIVTRLYAPSDLGVLAVFISILAPILSIVSFRYEVAIVLPTDDRTAKHLLWLSLSLACLSTGVLFGLVSVGGNGLLRFFGSTTLGPYLWLLPVSLFGGAVYHVLTYWAIRKQDFNLIGQTRIVQQGWLVCTQLVLGILVNGPIGLLVGDGIGRSAGSLRILSKLFPRNELWKCRPRMCDLLDVAKQYRRFPLFSTVPTLLNSFALQLPIFLLASQYGVVTVGLFALGQRILGVPLNLIGMAVSQVLLGSAAKLPSTTVSGLDRLFRRTLQKLLLIGVVFVVPVALVAPWTFGLIFGSNWHEAGVYVQLLAPMLLSQFVVGPIGGILDVLERQDLHLYREIVRIGLILGAVSVGIALDQGARSTIGLLSGAGVLGYLIGLFLAWCAIKGAGQRPTRNVHQ